MRIIPDLQKLVRRAEQVLGPAGMADERGRPRVVIEYACGFELFNDQPYQCYETWCCGLMARCLQKDGSYKNVKLYEGADRTVDFAEICYPFQESEL